MAVISVVSAKGSPGATVTALGLALAWPGVAPGRRALVVDADPVGGDMGAGILRGSVPGDRGMLALGASREQASLDLIERYSVDLTADGTVRVLPGIPDSARMTALHLATDRLRACGTELRMAGVDLVVDAGRVDPEAGMGPWIEHSDRVLLVLRPTLPSVRAARALVSAWGPIRVPLDMVLVSSPSPYGPVDVARAVAARRLHEVAFDARSARVYSDGDAPHRAFARTRFVRSLTQVAADLASDLEERLAVLPSGVTDAS